jgi:hypothetical protein
MARTCSYTKEIGDEICESIASGNSLRATCLPEHMPNKTTVIRWLLAEHNPDLDQFRTQYAQAREVQYQLMADELMEIADDGTNDYVFNNTEEGDAARINPEAIGRSRLRVDTRKWFMSKVLPKFKDKPDETPRDDMASVLQSLIDKLPN